LDTTTIIRVVAGCCFIAVLVVGLIYLAFLSGVLRKCSPTSRTMQPGMVWLSLIPLFGFIWPFFVVSAIADSLANEFRLRNVPINDPKPGKSVGVAMAISGACMVIPFVNIIAIFPRLILWIVYWVKIADFSRRLDLSPLPIAVAANSQVQL
jgi:hypothetical protein